MTPNTPTIVIENIRHGWADISFRHGHVVVFEACVSYLSDGLGALATAIGSVVTGRLSGAGFRWEVEPGAYVIAFRFERNLIACTIAFDPDFVGKPPAEWES